MPNLLVTGGARRIGAGIVRAAAAAGWGVVIHHHTSATEAESLAAELRGAGHPAWTLGADLADAGAAAELCGRASALCGGLEALVNNASLFLYDTPAAFEPAQFNAHTAVNLLAPALLTRGFAEQLSDSVVGCVVNMLDSRLQAPNPDFFTYALGKYALAGMTEMAALQFAPRIRVNGVAPALTLISGEQDEEGFRRAHVNNPLRRGVEPEDVARAVMYLLASPAVTGEVMLLDGGQRLRRRGRDVAFAA